MLSVKFYAFLLISIALHLAIYGLMALRSREKTVDMTIIEIGMNQSAPSAEVKKAKNQVKVIPQAKSQSELPEKASSEAGLSQTTEDAASGSAIGTEIVQAPRVIKEAIAKYPKAAKMAGIEGVVEMQVSINSQGLVENADIIKGPGYGLNEAALDAMKNFIFSPALRSGEKVGAKIIYRYRFILGGS